MPNRDERLRLLMNGLASPGVELYPRGEQDGAPWGPWAAAGDEVERYPAGKQEPGARVDLIRWHPNQSRLDFYLLHPAIPGACPRFANRACPRMAPMGHEPDQLTCNYWDWPLMATEAPGVELYPEWQRFDCHKYYPLFQLHLRGAALARRLNAECYFHWLSADKDDEKLMRVYAGFTRLPAAFSWSYLD